MIEVESYYPFVDWKKRITCSGQLHIQNTSRVLRKLKKLKRESANRLVIVSDFDFTLTHFRLPNGERGSSSYGVVETSRLLSEEYRDAALELKNKYYPMEISSELSHEEKFKKMEAWWHAAHELFVKIGLRRDTIKTIISESSFMFREGWEDFLKAISFQKVPLIVLSAGIGDILVEAFQQKGGVDESKFDDEILIVSNFLEFSSSSGECTGVRGNRIIHMLNKSEEFLHDDYSTKVSAIFEERSNILLLGDSLGDLNMVKNDDNTNNDDDSIIDDRRTVLSVGFLNDNVSTRLAEYSSAFDIVAVGDDGLEMIIDFMNWLDDDEIL